MTSFLLSMFSSFTLEPIFTIFESSSVASMICACASIFSKVKMRPSTKACSFFASSYSAFSERSPNSLARIKRAKEFGDLSENAEYDEAKKEQAFVEGRILTLEKMLAHAQIIEATELDSKIVNIGSKVKLLNMDNKKEVIYTIVGSFEADPKQARISDDSPLGKALLGKKAKDFV